MSEHKNKVTGSMLKWCDDIRRDFTDFKNELTFETEHVVAMVESKNKITNSCKNNSFTAKLENDKKIVTSTEFENERNAVVGQDEQSVAAVNHYLKQANEKLLSVNNLLERQYRETTEYNKLLERELSFVQQELKIEKAVRKGLFNSLEDELVILNENLNIVYQNKKMVEEYGDCAGKEWKVLFGDNFQNLNERNMEKSMRGMEKTVLEIQNSEGKLFEITIFPIRNLDLNLYTLLMKKELTAIGRTKDSSTITLEKGNLKDLKLSDVTNMENGKKGSVTHKIRTPLNSILTSARIIQKFNRKKPDAVDKFSQIVVDETYRIIDLIKNLTEN